MSEDFYCGVCGRLYKDEKHECPKGTLRSINQAETRSSKLELQTQPYPGEEIPIGALIEEGFALNGFEYEVSPSERVH